MTFHRGIAAAIALLVLAPAAPLRHAAGSQAAGLHGIGVTTRFASVPERGRSIELTVFYPARSDGTPERYGESRIFQGVAARRDASLADGDFPVVLLAHGGLRANPTASGWIGAYLAARGQIVAVAHPPELRRNDAGSAVAEIWLRPSDLASALDALEADAAFAAHLASGQVAAVGFFLGGTSALMIAGGRLDAESYRRSCDEPAAGPDCAWFAQGGVDLHRADGNRLAASHRDRRVGAAVIVNPELGASFSAGSLAEIDIPISLIGLGAPDPGLSELKELAPGVRSTTIADATRFSAFSRCTPQAAAILAEEGEEEALCRDGGERSREELHAEIGRIIAAALEQSLHE